MKLRSLFVGVAVLMVLFGVPHSAERVRDVLVLLSARSW